MFIRNNCSANERDENAAFMEESVWENWLDGTMGCTEGIWYK